MLLFQYTLADPSGNTCIFSGKFLRNCNKTIFFRGYSQDFAIENSEACSLTNFSCGVATCLYHTCVLLRHWFIHNTIPSIYTNTSWIYVLNLVEIFHWRLYFTYNLMCIMHVSIIVRASALFYPACIGHISGPLSLSRVLYLWLSMCYTMYTWISWFCKTQDAW